MPTAGEGDLKTNIAQLLLDRLGAGGSYTEYYALDFDEDFVLMGHDGPGHLAIAAFLPHRASLRGAPLRLVPTRANTQPAFGCYLPCPQAPIVRPYGLIVLTLQGDRISAITWFGAGKTGRGSDQEIDSVFIRPPPAASIPSTRRSI